MFLVSRQFSIFRRVLLLLLCLLPFAASHAHSRGVISGQVTDSNGMPLEGVTVSVKNGPTALSNAGGMFTLGDVKQKQHVVVTFRKKGYLTTQGAVSLKVNSRTDHGRRGGDRKSLRDDHDDDAEEGESGKLAQATLVRRMLKLGAVQTISAASGGTVKEAGSKVTFPTNGLTVNGDVQVTVTPIDVSSSAISAAPGDFVARASSGQRVLLETFTMADISLSQNGQPVNLAPGVQASLELLLPTTTRLQAGDTQPMWYFSEKNGLWIEEGVGTVAASTEVPGRLAAFAEVTHFSAWNLDLPYYNPAAVRGRVVDAAGQPVAGAYVNSVGMNFFGTSRTTTDGNGYFCILARPDSTIELHVSSVLGNQVMGTATSGPVQTGAGSSYQSACSAATVIPDMVIQPVAAGGGIACVSGYLYNCSLSNPASTLQVIAYDMAGNPLGVSPPSVNGNYCIDGLPANTAILIDVPGFYNPSLPEPFGPLPANSGNGGGTCAASACNTIPAIDVFCF